MQNVFMFATVAALLSAAVMLTWPVQSGSEDRPALVSSDLTVRYEIGGDVQDLYGLSLQKKLQREEEDRYRTYRTIADREHREAERDKAFDDWAEDERELRALLSEQRRDD